jgi:hypothetical protein
MLLASTAARGAPTEQIDALAQRAFVRGYNCPTVIPELRKTRRSLGDKCLMKDLMKIAEQTEADYSINRNRANDRQKQPSKRDQKQVRLVTPAVAAVASTGSGTPMETRQQPDDRPVPGWMQCHKCGGYGHLKRMCISEIDLKLEPWRKRDATQQGPTQTGVVASLAPTLPVATQATVQPQKTAAAQNSPPPQQPNSKSKKKYRSRKRDPRRQPEEESPRDSGSADDDRGSGGQVQVTRMVLRREYRNLEPVRYPIEPLSSEEDTDDASESGTRDGSEDSDVSREVNETQVSSPGTEGSEVEATTPPGP